MFATERHFWTHDRQVGEDGDTVHVLQRQTSVRNLASWDDLSDVIRIAGTTPARAQATLGYVSLGDVQFRNTVRVERGEASGGGTSFSFRETFRWDNGFDALAEFLIGYFDRTLENRYPRLSARQRGEIVGFARAQLWAAMEDGLLEAGGDEEKRLWARVIEGTAGHAIKIVRLRYPNEDETFMKNALEQLYTGDDDEIVAFFEEIVPGLNLGLNTNIVFRLTMPGRVTSSNAQDTDGNTLVWEFGPTDALASPVELFAESVVGRPAPENQE
jgi:hypothetical protein